MSIDPGSAAGLDWTEREARFVVENDEYQQIRDALDGQRKIGSYALGKSKAKQHDDTYFDTPDYSLTLRSQFLLTGASDRLWVQLA